MGFIRTILRTAASFIIVWLVSALALTVTAWLLPGISIHPVGSSSAWPVALAAAFVIGLVNVLLRPLLLLLAVPLGFIGLFVVGLLTNSVTLLLASLMFPAGLVVDNLFSAFVGGIVLGTAVALISALLGVEDTGSFYEGVIERRLHHQREELPENLTMGVVMLEIDGLSYHHLRKAMADGHMPNVRAMMERDGYALSRVDCGLPSQTSACQAGILFGDNYDIPAYRWYDKAEGKLYVSGADAAEINARYANGQGLLRGGVSVSNLVNGDAMRSLLTVSDLRGGTDEQRRARAHDIYLLLLNPNFLMRVLGMFIGESLLEVAQYIRDVVRDTQPRLNRLRNFYPFIRSSATVFMREVSGVLTMMQIVRGEPVIYTTWPGYDEVAHHSGPSSRAAFGTLRGFDRLIGSVRHILATKAPRPYELLLLSDHGQSFGPTFRMRYGYTLREFIERHMPAGTVTVQADSGDDGSLVASTTAAELDNIQDQKMGGRVGQATTRQIKRAVERGVAEAGRDIREAPPQVSEAADVTFCGSGNLAHVYFHLFGHRATLGELDGAFPGLVDALVSHEGVGIVVAMGDDGAPIVYGKGGARNLHTGELDGRDPLAQYGDVALRAWQVRRLADFPSSGDLIIISTVYPDGTVAALEELIGNHGGLGGPQTDAFLLHPPDMRVPPTRNAIDLFPVLDARRERPAKLDAPAATSASRDDWATRNLLAGLRDVREWVELALLALILDRSAYRVIAMKGSMTGPALLLSLLGVLVTTLMDETAADASGLAVAFVARYGLWLFTAVVIHGAARVLRGEGNFTRTFRALGFAQVVSLFGLFRAVEPIEPMVTALVILYGGFVAWLAVTEAHRFRGLRTLLLPLVYFSVLIFGGTLLLSLTTGISAALQMLLNQFTGSPSSSP